MSKINILILGGTGFIGSSFYNEMEENKKDMYHFHLLIRDKKSHIKSSKNTTVYYGDIKSFTWSNLTHFPEFVYHFARINSSKGKGLGRKFAAFNGKKANKRLLKYLNSKSKETQIFYLSGSLMYGDSKNPIYENNILNPISFAKEYYNAETPFFKKKYTKLKITMVRVPWVLGNGSWFNGFYKNYILENNKVPIYGDGKNIMSFITSKDLAICLSKLIGIEYKNTIHITYNESITQNIFTQTIAEKLNIETIKIPLKNNYEKAIIEAFESNIDFKTSYSFLDEIIKRDSLIKIISKEISLIFENK